MSAYGEPLSKTEFWMRVAGWSFGLWSLMIPVGIWMIRDTLEHAAVKAHEAAVENSRLQAELRDYVFKTEKRLDLLEERQKNVINHLRDVNGRLDALEGRNRSGR